MAEPSWLVKSPGRGGLRPCCWRCLWRGEGAPGACTKAAGHAEAGSQLEGGGRPPRARFSANCVRQSPSLQVGPSLCTPPPTCILAHGGSEGWGGFAGSLTERETSPGWYAGGEGAAWPPPEALNGRESSWHGTRFWLFKKNECPAHILAVLQFSHRTALSPQSPSCALDGVSGSSASACAGPLGAPAGRGWQAHLTCTLQRVAWPCPFCHAKRLVPSLAPAPPPPQSLATAPSLGACPFRHWANQLEWRGQEEAGLQQEWGAERALPREALRSTKPTAASGARPQRLARRAH